MYYRAHEVDVRVGLLIIPGVFFGGILGGTLATSLSLALRNGTYLYFLNARAEYLAESPIGSVEVNGTGVTRSVVFTLATLAIPPSSGGAPFPWGLTALEVYSLTGVLLLAVALAAVVLLVRRRRRGKDPVRRSSDGPKPPR